MFKQRQSKSKMKLAYRTKLTGRTRQSRIADFAPATKSFAKVTTATVTSAVRSLSTVNVYAAGALWRMRLNHDGNVLSLLYAPLWANVTSSTKREAHNLLHCRQTRTESWPQVTCTGNFVKFGVVVFEICERTDRQTCGHARRNTSHPCPGRSKKNVNSVYCCNVVYDRLRLLRSYLTLNGVSRIPNVVVSAKT